MVDLNKQLNAKELEERRLAALDASTSYIQEIYRSRNTGIFLESIARKYSIEENDFNTFAYCVGDILLNLKSISGLSETLSRELHIGIETAKNITADLIDFLSPVLKEQEAATTPLPKKAGVVPQPIPSQAAVTPSQNQSSAAASTTAAPAQPPQIAETTTTVEPLRTMEKDVDRIHGYGAYRKLYPDVADTESITTPQKNQQEDISSKTPAAGYQAQQTQNDVITSLSQDEMLKGKLADTPSYTDPNTPQQ